MIGALGTQAAQRLGFRVGPSSLLVESGDAAATEMLERAYGGVRPLDDRAPMHRASLTRTADGRLLVRFDRRMLSAGVADGSEPLVGAYYALRELFAHFSASGANLTGLYGTVVAQHGRGLLLLGPTRIGKTVLALHLVDRGAAFLGEESTMLDLRSSTLWPIARRPALREGAIEWIPASMRDGVQRAASCLTARGRFWYALNGDALGFDVASQSVPLTTVAIVRARAEAPALRRIDVAAAFPQIAARAYARPTELAAESALRRALRHTTCFELTLGQPEETAQLLAEHAVP